MPSADEIPNYLRPREQRGKILFVRDLDCSLQFYGAIGFEIEAQVGCDAKLSWEGRILVL